MSKQNPTRPFKGLHKDNSPIDQPKGSYTMAWNAINETSEGDNNFLSNEESNELCGGNLGTGYVPIGDVYISDGNTVVFSTDGTNSQIGIVDSDCNYTSKVITPGSDSFQSLEFRIDRQIDATFRVRRGCERVVYFTDGVNPVRHFNFDTPEDFKNSAGTKWDKELFKLFLDFNQPSFIDFEIKEQGALRSGTYSFAIQYLDKDLNPTAWSHVSLPIPIVQATLFGEYIDITGSSNSDVDSLGGTGNSTTKSITVHIDDLDSNYEYYRFAVIEASSSQGTITNIYASHELPITQTSFIYGGETEGFTKVTEAEIGIPPVDIHNAEHIEQLENKLILANVKGKDINYCKFQPYASRITSKYVVQSGPAGRIGLGNPKTPSTYWFSKGYMGDEVYAFGIVYVFKDGTESPAFHIPGRSIKDPATCNGSSGSSCSPAAGTTTYQSIEILTLAQTTTSSAGVTSYYLKYVDSNGATALDKIHVTINTPVTSATAGWVNIFTLPSTTAPEYPITSIVGIFKDASCTVPGVNNNGATAYILAEYNFNVGASLITTNYNNNTLCPQTPIGTWDYNMAHIYPPETSTDYNTGGVGPLQRWQVYNTAKALSTTEGYMAFWESATSTYTNILDCVPNGDGLVYWGNDACGDPLVGQKIRHHKFPDRNLVAHLTKATAEDNQCEFEVYMLINVLSCTGGTGVTKRDIKVMFQAANPATIATWQDVTNTDTIDLHVDVTLGGVLTTEVIQVSYLQFSSVATIPNVSAGCTVAKAMDWEPFSVFIGSYSAAATGGPPPTTCTAPTVALTPGAPATTLGKAGPTTYNITINESNNTNTTAAGVNGNVEESSSTLVQPSTELQVKNLGIKFENIRYPHKDIIGHYIVRGERDEFNRTVISKGFTNSLTEATEKNTNYTLKAYLQGGWYNSGVKGRSDSMNYVVTPKALFADDPQKGAYIKQEQFFNNNWTETRGNNPNWAHFDDLTQFGAGPGNSAQFDTDGSQPGYVLGTRKISYTGLRNTVPNIKIRPILDNLSLDGCAYDSDFASTNPGQDRLLYNLSHTNKAHIIKILDGGGAEGSGNNEKGMHGFSGRDMPYISLKIDRDVHINLENIKYYRTHNSLIRDSDALNPTGLTPADSGVGTTYGSSTVFGGDIIIGEMNYGNTILYKISESVWGSIAMWAAAVVLVVTSVVVSVFTYGAASVSIPAAIIAAGVMVGASITLTSVTIGELVKHILTDGLSDVLDNDTEFSAQMFTNKSAWWFANEFLEDIYIESEFNLGYRQDHSAYSGGNFNRELTMNGLQKYFRDKIMYWNPDNPQEAKDKWLYRGTPIPEVYHYNLDYSRITKENVYMSLPASWDCCAGCVDKHPNRVHHSQQSFQEENIDNYRIFLANNYKDLEGEKGEITDLFRKGNSLYIHTEESLWLLPQNMQERITGEFLSFIGTGEYFSVPPRLVKDDELGTAGTRHKWATVKTDNGIFFIDEASKGVFRIDAQKGLSRISNLGMKAEFKMMLTPYFCEQYYAKTTKVFPNRNNHANPHGVGYHVVYDSQYNRVIFTKRDYKMLSSHLDHFVITSYASGEAGGLPTGKLIFSTYNNYFAVVNGGSTTEYTEIDLGFDNTTYFENKSWTISYDLINNSWTSMHSYLPLYYYYIHDKFYSFKNNSDEEIHKIWKHNTLGSYQNFYGNDYPHIIEYVSLSSPIINKIWDDVMLQTVTSLYEVVTGQYVPQENKTFNKAVFYNSTQCSGELNLTIKDDTDENYLINQIVDAAADYIIISKDERNWKLNEIRDYRKDYNKPIWSKQWDLTKNTYPIDKVLNSTTIDFNKIWSDLQLLRDKYLIIRLIFDNLDNNIRLTTNYSFERETPSIR